MFFRHRVPRLSQRPWHVKAKGSCYWWEGAPIRQSALCCKNCLGVEPRNVGIALAEGLCDWERGRTFWLKASMSGSRRAVYLWTIAWCLPCNWGRARKPSGKPHSVGPLVPKVGCTAPWGRWDYLAGRWRWAPPSALFAYLRLTRQEPKAKHLPRFVFKISLDQVHQFFWINWTKKF
jgi:hypothetical protein